MDLSKELEAQKKRVAALNYLKSQGQDIKTNHDIVKDIDKKDNSRIGGDNTLELLFKQKVSSQDSKRVEIALKTALIQQQKELQQINKETTEAITTTVGAVSSKDESSTEVVDLPADWNAVYDKTSRSFYYWNKVTNITTWEKPLSTGEVISTSVESSSSSSNSNEETLPSDDMVDSEWIAKVHEASKQKYWLNQSTGEKCFDKNQPSNSKTGKSSNNSNASNSVKTSSSNSSSSSSRDKDINKKRKYDIDPLDFTGGKGDSYGRITGDRMADSTAGGPLWQQRPYPAPGKILNTAKNTMKSSIGPSSSSSSSSSNIFFKKSK